MSTQLIDANQTNRLSHDDLRDHHRRDVEQDLWLTDMLGETVLRCSCKNLGAGGIMATAQLGYGLAIGQRYELRLGPGKGRTNSLLLGDSLGYATIIRTQIQRDGSDENVLFAARFDSPQYLPI